MRAPVRPHFEYLPLGGPLELAVFENILGDANFIVRRDVFQKLGGFTIERSWHRRVVHEDYAFLVRLAFAKYNLDVIPEPLFFYRCRARSLSRSTDPYLNTQRVHDIYRRELRKAGLEHLVGGVYALYTQQRGLAFVRDQLLTHWRMPFRTAGFVASKLLSELRRGRRRPASPPDHAP
jgi:hypothetical protein